MAKCGATVTRRSMDNCVKRFHERDAALAREATIAAKVAEQGQEILNYNIKKIQQSTAWLEFAECMGG